ncbi:MAG: polymer-forming cytoskeletal protein [Candidatus Brocadiaceae bacterium]|nr:polymer-forming cytoskeletal protein [Candidatus Brocadiaceae bacterium]
MASFFKRNTGEAVLVDEGQGEYIIENKSRKEIKMREGNVTHLTPDAEFKGTIKFDKVLRIDGKFEGDMITNDGEVIVGSTGAIKANVKVKNAIVEGQVEGNLIASEKVELRKNAKLLGDLKAKTLSIDEGVVFVGKCSVHPDGFKAETQKMIEEEE